jgi:hypothetical protein
MKRQRMPMADVVQQIRRHDVARTC